MSSTTLEGEVPVQALASNGETNMLFIKQQVKVLSSAGNRLNVICIMSSEYNVQCRINSIVSSSPL